MEGGDLEIPSLLWAREKEKGHIPEAQRQGWRDRAVVGGMGWREGRRGHKPFHCLCLPTASPLAGGAPAGGTGRLLVSVRRLS